MQDKSIVVERRRSRGVYKRMHATVKFQRRRYLSAIPGSAPAGRREMKLIALQAMLN